MSDPPFIIFVPGCFSTSLVDQNQKEVWPLSFGDKVQLFMKSIVKPLSTPFSNNEKEDNLGFMNEFIETLRNPNLRPGPIIYKFYKSFIETINTLSDGNFLVFNYDWRKPLDVCVENLKKAIDEIVTDREIVLIGHSAGGLIASHYLSNGLNSSNNYRAVKKMIAIGSPIQGSVLALSSILGMSSRYGLYKDSIRNFMESGVFELIFDLCPTTLHNLFFYKSNNQPLSTKQVIECLRRSGFSREKLERIVRYQADEREREPNPSVQYTFISGMNSHVPMPTGFYIDNNEVVETIISYGVGDGTILKSEATFHPEFVFKHHGVIGKHSYLTELDSVQEIIKNEILSSASTSSFVETNLLKYNKDEMSIRINIVQRNNVYNVTNLKAKHISFSYKSFTSDITTSITKKAKTNVFKIKSKHPYGFLRFRDVIFEYMDENNEKKELYVKEVRSEIEPLDSYNIV